jgi:hypothetical protein
VTYDVSFPGAFVDGSGSSRDNLIGCQSSTIMRSPGGEKEEERPEGGGKAPNVLVDEDAGE